MMRKPQPSLTSAERAEWSAALRLIYGHWIMYGHKVTICPTVWARGALRCGVRHWRTV
jgi:hypothetical protein